MECKAMKKWSLLLGVAVALAAFTPAQGQAWVRVGIGIGFPIYAGPYPYYGPYYYPYYQPYPAYVTPAPVYAAPAPTAVQQPAPVYQQPVPTVRAQEAHSPSYDETVPPPKLVGWNQADFSRSIQQLSNQDERARSDAAIELGRMKAQQAIDPLSAMLQRDSSPQARETAARALGLIGSPRALAALQNAALADNDREVRHSAQFSAEVIRANLRRE
jgi:HEAT repeats